MSIEMKFRHPDYGVGTVQSVSEHLADIRFDSGLRTLAPEHSDLQPAEALAEISGLTAPLFHFGGRNRQRHAQRTRHRAGRADEDRETGRALEKRASVMRPTDGALQSKEVPLEVFFHKIVMSAIICACWNKR